MQGIQERGIGMIKWAICDDADYLCKSFEWAFEDEKDLAFMGAANDSISCLHLISAQDPEVILLDIQMETPTAGIDLISQIRSITPDIKIIMLTNYDDDDYVFSSFVQGANDFIVKSSSNKDILKAIRDVYNNTTMLRPEIASKIIHKGDELKKENTSLVYMINLLTKLSTSEFEVLRYCYYGETYKCIAETRFVDVSTIRTLASRILKKFSYHSMNDLINELRKYKIFDYLEENPL